MFFKIFPIFPISALKVLRPDNFNKKNIMGCNFGKLRLLPAMDMREQRGWVILFHTSVKNLMLKMKCFLYVQVMPYI